MDDRDLLRDYVEGRSQDAFRDLVGRHLPMVYATARRIVRDSQLAEEVAQSVFTTLARKAESIRPPHAVGGWLYNTTRHLALNAVRSEQRRRERELTAVAMQSLDSASDTPLISEHLEPAMAELAEDDRDALVLRYLENRSLREVGAELDISEDAARMRVNRALERLRTGFERRGVAVTAALLGAAMTASTTPVSAGLTTAIGSAAPAALTFTTSAGAGAGTGFLGVLSQVFRMKLVTGIATTVVVGVATFFVLRSQHSTDRGASFDPRPITARPQREGAQYELGGSLDMTAFHGDGTVYRHMSGRFAVSVQGSRWYIRYTPNESKTHGKPDEFVEDYRAASYDGTNIYELTAFDAAVQRVTVFRDGKQLHPENVAACTIQARPAPQALVLQLEILWLAFASRSYFETVSQPWILPLFSRYDDLQMYRRDYRVLGSWKVNAEPPGLPSRVSLSEVYKFSGARVGTPYRPSAIYQAVQFTNAHGLTIPQVCLVTNYGVGTSVIAVTQILLDEVKTNRTVRGFCLPITARGNIRDERFVADASPFRFSYDATNWLSRESALQLYIQRTTKRPWWRLPK